MNCSGKKAAFVVTIYTIEAVIVAHQRVGLSPFCKIKLGLAKLRFIPKIPPMINYNKTEVWK
ncbi:MAG: hypothetical protein ABFD50_03250 [Smithella sp.]